MFCSTSIWVSPQCRFSTSILSNSLLGVHNRPIRILQSSWFRFTFHCLWLRLLGQCRVQRCSQLLESSLRELGEFRLYPLLWQDPTIQQFNFRVYIDQPYAFGFRLRVRECLSQRLCLLCHTTSGGDHSLDLRLFGCSVRLTAYERHSPLDGRRGRSGGRGSG